MYNTNAINLIYWNANGIVNKIDELYDYLQTNDIHIACISETFLKYNIRLKRHPDYIVHRLDRADRAKGGVAIIVNKTIKHSLQPSLDLDIIESIGIEINLQNGSKVTIYSIYLPGSTSHQDITSKYANDIKKLINIRGSYFLCGDLNSKHRFWNCARANPAGNILYNLYCNNNFIIESPNEHTYLPSDANRRQSTIDLILTNGLHQSSKPECTTLLSDHAAIKFSIETSEPPVTCNSRIQYDYSQANWEKYRGLIHHNVGSMHFNLDNINTTAQVDQHILKLTKVIEHARDKAVPLAFHTSHKLNLTPEVISLIRIKNDYKRRWRRNREHTLKQTVNKLEAEIKSNIDDIRNKNWNKKLADIKPSNQSVWKTARFLKNSNKTMPPLKVNQHLCITNSEKANAIADTFESNHKNPLENNNPNFTNETDDIVERFINEDDDQIAEYPDIEEIETIVQGLKNPKAPGRDTIKNSMIKMLPNRGKYYILFIITACIKLRYFPDSWKHANVVPILKPSKDPANPGSYRPISLLNGLSKILERVMLNRITKHANDTNIIPDIQHGFQKGKSTVHQLKRTISYAKAGLTNKESTGMVTLDVEKAFDRVYHNGLIAKMIGAKFPTYTIKMVHAFLSKRRFTVSINGASSNDRDIKSGVPQGAVLSPFLYNIYTSDIPLSGSHETALFADDTALFKSASKAQDIQRCLTAATNQVDRYFDKWKINVNHDKTNAIFITKRRIRELPGQHINLFNKQIKWSDEIKYLGVIFDKRMTFQRHIEYVIERANTAVRVLYPLLCRKSRLNIQNKLLIYKLAIRPILTYATPAMNGISECHIKKLQIIQNKALKMITNVSRYERTTELHKNTNIPLIGDYIRKLTDKFDSNRNEI